MPLRIAIYAVQCPSISFHGKPEFGDGRFCPLSLFKDIRTIFKKDDAVTAESIAQIKLVSNVGRYLLLDIGDKCRFNN